MAVVYQTSISGSLDSTINAVDSSEWHGPSMPPWHPVFLAGINVACSFTTWHPVNGYVSRTAQYSGRLMIDDGIGDVVRQQEYYNIGIGPFYTEWGAASSTFSPLGGITIEEIIDDVIVTIAGGIGSHQWTFTGERFVHITEDLGSASAQWVYNLATLKNQWYGEVLSVANPTRLFENGGVGNAFWSDWETLTLDEGLGNVYTVSTNATGSIVQTTWPPFGVGLRFDHGSLSGRENCSTLEIPKLTVLDSISPGVPVEIEFLPSPTIYGITSPQDTAFAFVPREIVTYLEKYGGDPPVENLVTVIAPAANPSGYTWNYWDFLLGDHRLSKTQDFLLDADRTIIATYEEWVAEDAVAMWVDSKQIPFAAATFNGALYIKRRSESPATWAGAILIDDSSSAGYSNPGIVMTDDGRIIVTALDGDEATVDAAYVTFYSDDFGTTWTGPV